MSVQQAFISYTCSLGSPFCLSSPTSLLPATATAPHIPRFYGTGSPVSSKPLSWYVPFSPHFAPEGLSESVMITKAADLRDSPWRRERTAVHRHIAENAASNSWGSDRLRSGWPPHSADVNLKEQPFPLICSWLFRLPFISREKEPAWLASWLLEKFIYLLMFYTCSISFLKKILEKTQYHSIHQNNKHILSLKNNHSEIW